MVKSKAWDWAKNKEDIWYEPCEEAYYFLNRWRKSGFKNFLDLGCGLGRHSILFAKSGFAVSAIDLSRDAVSRLEEWARKESLSIEANAGDMLQLPYAAHCFDCLLAYNVISHTDTAGVVKTLGEIRRVLKPGGEFYVSLASKNNWSYREADFSKVDENTVIRTDEGPEAGIPHFYTDYNLVLELCKDFVLLRIRHVQDFNMESRTSSWHYFIHGKKPAG